LDFLPFPKVGFHPHFPKSPPNYYQADRKHKDDGDFRKFRRQLFHTSLEYILSSLRPHMTQPRITKCGDGQFHRVVYGLGPYIADYPEQTLLACVVQDWCAKYVI
jgi:hypothetical protein